MTGAMAMRQREAAMPFAAHVVLAPAGCALDHRSLFAITYGWYGGDRGNRLTAKSTTRRLGRSST
jgi:hypothetical protein